jgi:hypothetical protein
LLIVVNLDPFIGDVAAVQKVADCISNRGSRFAEDFHNGSPGFYVGIRHTLAIEDRPERLAGARVAAERRY